mmetsp:Transcript_23764/g.43058  ORF Transcript_23764/g.43058 Transcript_23764/m.43058 type:complete len:1221 (+) Transcript_23764:46-3708(+)
MAEVDLTNTTVRVAVRVRPFSEKELREGGTECVEVGKDGTVSLQQDEDKDPSQFAFDHVFGKDSTQPFVFEMLGMPLLDKSFEGYNSTIFAYGQTGSGKTHTMMSDRKSDDRGLIPRISENLFERIAKLTSDSRKFLVCCSFLEIYNEIVYDLLVPRGKNTPKTGLEIREGKGIGVYVKDLQEIVVDSSEKLQKLIDQGFEHRATAATQMNASSSRSHCLFIIKMHQKDDRVASNNNFSKMNLVDLAGSERASRTGAQGDTLKEGANINKSLSALGNVINTLSSMAAGDKKVFIPYRNSKLTRVLQESLGGNALTTMMAAVSPSKTNCDETLSTLNYAKRAKTIKVNASKNEEAEHLAKLEEEVEALRSKLAEHAAGNADTSRYQSQIEEMERFRRQTWEDKERDSQKHEEQRKALEKEAQKIAERANEEQRRRLKLLEDSGDLEQTVQELRSLDGGDEFNCWSSQIAAILRAEQRVSAECRAVALCKDAAMHDIDAWCERQSSEQSDSGAGGRMLLQQAERKVSSMLRELDALSKQETELEAAVALLLPQVRRAAKLTRGRNDDTENAKNQTEEYCHILSLAVRQLDTHRCSIWGKICEEHKALGDFSEKLDGLLGCCRDLGADIQKLDAETKEELGKAISSGSVALGAEVCGAAASPLGLASEELPDARIKASSNAEAASCVRLFGGVERVNSTFGGWVPSGKSKEYLQIDLPESLWISGLALQGRQPVSGDYKQSRPLFEKVLSASEPIPPERLFRRPPVRLVHDVFITVHGKCKELQGEVFTPAQMDYEQLSKLDRQSKVHFFELLLSRTTEALSMAGWLEKIRPLTLSASDILAGKNTGETNRLIQLLCYLALRKKMGQKSATGLLNLADQWVKKFKVDWSEDGKSWTSSDAEFTGCEDAEQVRYQSLWALHPSKPVRFLRIKPVEWHEEPGLRLEVFGFASRDLKGSGSQRLHVIRRRSLLLQRCLGLASNAEDERWRKAQKAEEEKSLQALAEKSHVEQQLHDAMKELKKMRKAGHAFEKKVAESDAEKLRLQVELERAETQVKAFEAKFEVSTEGASDAKKLLAAMEEKMREMQSSTEDLQQQIGVLTDERDCARATEEELFDLLNDKEEEIMNTNQGYVNLTEQLHEEREEFEEKLDERDQIHETLNHRNQELLDETMRLRKELSDLRKRPTSAVRPASAMRPASAAKSDRLKDALPAILLGGAPMMKPSS